MNNTMKKLRAEARRLVATYTPAGDFDTLVAKLATIGHRLIEARLEMV